MQPSRGLQKPLPNLSIDMTPRILFKMLQLSDPTPLPSAGYRRHTNELEDIRMNWGSFFSETIHSYVFQFIRMCSVPNPQEPTKPVTSFSGVRLVWK